MTHYVQVQCLLWKSTIELSKTAELFCEALKKLISEQLEEEVELEYSLHDVTSFEPPDIDRTTIVFGNMAASTIQETDDVWIFDDLARLVKGPNNNESRKAAFEDLRKLAVKIASDIKGKTHKQIVKTEKDGVTFGKEDTDIQLTEQEIQYLKNIKELLGKSKIIISKGNTRIELED